MKDEFFAFVLMPFDEAFSDVYQLGIKGPLEEEGIRVERVDEQTFHRETILQRIYNQISAADFIIADMTDRNPNVFYEVGYAHAKEKACILLTQSANDIPFDLKHHRHIVYSHIRDLKKRIVRDARGILKEQSNAKKKPAVDLHASGYLEKTKHTSRARITLKFDIHNDTDVVFRDIEAIYLHTSEKWSFKQDDKDCPNKKLDTPKGRQHFIITPIRSLQPGAWAHVVLKGRMLVASTFFGEELVSKHHHSGILALQVQTAREIFDYKFPLDLDLEEFPF